MSPNWIKAIERMKIQKKYHTASLDNCSKIPPELVELGKKWVNATNRPNLYLHGNVGSGKTHFATSLFRAMCEKYLDIMIFRKSDDLDDELLSAISSNEEKTKLEKYFEVPILFIDDLGVEKGTERTIRQYYSIIDRRVGEELITVITSNISKEKLCFGDRVSSRLEHFYNIKFPDIDIRKTIELPPL